MSSNSDADAPYDSTAFADVILRSSDNVHFYVLGPLLCLVSPIFREMFSINRGPAVKEDERKDSHPIIPVEEDSQTLRLLLDLIYPFAKERPLDSVTLLRNVGKAAQKYFIDGVEDKIKDRIMTSDLISKEPLHISVIAIDLDWEDIATEAARRTLRIPLENLPHVDELHNIPGSGFYRFLEYRFRCGKSSNAAAETLMKLPTNTAGSLSCLNLATTRPPGSDLPSDAPEPFNFSEKADLVFRSSDDIDFFVSEALIRFISPVFDRMFPLKNQVTKGGRPVIAVREDSKPLHLLLSTVYYHIDGPDMLNCELYQKVVLAARAYEMTAIERRLRNRATDSSLMLKEPLKLYIISKAVGWEDAAKKAALNTLFKPLQDMAYAEELRLITGADLYQLMRYRFRCADVAWKLLEANEYFREYGPGAWDRHWYHDSFTSYKSISLQEFKQKITACPRGSTITEIYNYEIDGILKKNVKFVNGNQQLAAGKILKCWSQLGNVVEEAVSKVPLNSPMMGVGKRWPKGFRSQTLSRTQLPF